jgi:leader peptidase (prepilin peptidase) / N-methyltransferase
MSESDVADPIGSKEELRPNFVLLLAGGAVIALMSGMFLPWPAAIASTVLGALMIAGADVDARTFLLPDAVTWGAVAAGIVAAPMLGVDDPWLAVSSAVVRALSTALVLELLRRFYARVRRREGLGFGDVKLGAAVGAWLPLDAMPLCFGLAASAALVFVMVAHLRGETIEGATKLPFGAFLCPALWLVFYASALP